MPPSYRAADRNQQITVAAENSQQLSSTIAPETRNQLENLKRRRRLLLGNIDEIEAFIQNFDINISGINQVRQRQIQLSERLCNINEILQEIVMTVM